MLGALVEERFGRAASARRLIEGKGFGMAREHGRTAQGMTRRSFLKGGSAFLGMAAGTAMLSGGVLGGCAPGEGGGGSSGGSQQAVTADGVRFTVYDTDLIIVGAGFSGAVSALECASQSKNAILIEKGPYGFGGGCGMNWDIVWRFQPNLKHDPTANFTLSNKTLME